MSEWPTSGLRVATSGMVEMKSGEEPALLLVDDDAPLRRSLQRALERRGFRVFPGESYKEGLNLIHSLKLHYAVIDLRLEDGSGIDLVRRLREIHSKARVVILTGYGNIATAVAAVKAGAIDYLAKPVDADEVIAALLATGAALPPPPQIPCPRTGFAGNIFSACSSSATATCRRRRDGSTCTGAPCSGS